MKVAVIGGAGFIGSRIVTLLGASADFEAVPIVRAGHSNMTGARIGDALDQEELTAALSGCDAAIHSISGDPATIVGAIQPLISAGNAAGLKRIVYLSSASVHGQSPEPGTDESSPLRGDQEIAYNNAKVEAERRLRAKASPEIVILRPGIVYGPDCRWTNDFAQALEDGSACLVNRGEGICNACHVDNLVEAIRLSLITPEAAGETFIVGDVETIRWRDLYAPVAAGLNRTLDDLPPAPVPIDGSDSPRASWWSRLIRRRSPQISRELFLLQSCSVRLPIAKAQRILGYVPPVSFGVATAQIEAHFGSSRSTAKARR